MADRLPRTAAEFFAGIGLVRMGLERAGWAVLYANDIDPQKRAMYEHHFGPCAHYDSRDVHTVAGSDVPDVTLATASFPCTDLSLAGGRSGLNGRHSSAFWGFVSVLDGKGERRPPLVLLENVVGFLTSKGGSDLAEALLALARMGYLLDAFVIDAAWFVPQSRQRLFVVGMDRRICERVKEPPFADLVMLPDEERRPAALTAFMRSHPDLPWAVRALPPLRIRQARLQDVLEDLPPDDDRWWSPARAQYLLGQMSERHRKVADELIAAPRTSVGTVFRRVRAGRTMAELRTDGTAGCLRTPRGGSGRQILFVAGSGSYRVRLLTPRECARLMGADGYRIAAPLNQALFGFGDAVCVPVIEWIAEQYLEPLLTPAPKEGTLERR